MPESFPIPDELAERLKPVEGHLAEILRLGLEEWERSRAPAAVAGATPPEELEAPGQDLPEIDLDAVRAHEAEQAETLRVRQTVHRRIWWTCILTALFCAIGGLLAFGIPVARAEWLAAEIEAVDGDCETESFLPESVVEFLDRCPLLDLIPGFTHSRIIGITLPPDPHGKRLLPLVLQRSELQVLRINSIDLPPGSLRGLSRLTRLEHLDLEDTNVTDEDLAGLAGMKGLVHLILSGTKVTGPGLRHAAGLPELQQVWLERCKLTPEACVHIAQIRDLSYLSLASTGLRDEDALPLASLKRLSRVEAAGTQFGDRALRALTQSPRMAHVDFSDTQVTDEGLKALAKCTALQTLLLEGTKVRGPGLTFLPSLNSLNLSRAPVTDAGLACLQPVKVLQLSKTSISDQGLRNLLHLHGSLKVLDLRETAVSPSALAVLRPLRLETLALFRDGKHKLTGAELDEAEQALPAVRIVSTLTNYE